MHRNDGVDFEPDANGVGRDGFREGDPDQDPPINASEVGAKILNTVQEELARSVELLGETLDENDNEQLGTILAALAYGATALPTTPTRTKLYSVSKAQPSVNASGVCDWQVQQAPWSQAVARAVNATLIWCLSDLPAGAVITKIRLLVNPGSSHSPSDAMFVRGDRHIVTSTTPSTPFTSGPFYCTTGSGAREWIDSGTISLNVTAAGVVEITARSNSVTAAGDVVEMLEVTFTDPGPRNF